MTGKILKTDDEDKILNHPEKKIHIEQRNKYKNDIRFLIENSIKPNSEGISSK